METQLSMKPGTILFSSPELSAASSAPQQLSGTWHCSAGRGAVGGKGWEQQTDKQTRIAVCCCPLGAQSRACSSGLSPGLQKGGSGTVGLCVSS